MPFIIFQKQYRSLSTSSTAGMYALITPFRYSIFGVGSAPASPGRTCRVITYFRRRPTSSLLGKAPPLLVLAGYAESARHPGSVTGLMPKIYHAKYSHVVI